MVQSFETNVAQHFAQYVERLVNVDFSVKGHCNHIDDDESMTKDEKDEHKKTFWKPSDVSIAVGEWEQKQRGKRKGKGAGARRRCWTRSERAQRAQGAGETGTMGRRLPAPPACGTLSTLWNRERTAATIPPPPYLFSLLVPPSSFSILGEQHAL
jgi:hypothetical protein